MIVREPSASCERKFAQVVQAEILLCRSAYGEILGVCGAVGELDVKEL